jgi:hypothetical protein
MVQYTWQVGYEIKRDYGEDNYNINHGGKIKDLWKQLFYFENNASNQFSMPTDHEAKPEMKLKNIFFVSHQTIIQRT